MLLAADAHLLYSEAVHIVGDVFLIDHEAHEHVLVWQFLLIALGIEAVEHIVVLHR